MLTGPEVLAASLLSTFAAPVVAAYLLDRLGLGFGPWRLVPIALFCGAGAWLWMRRDGKPASTDAVCFGAVVACVLAWLIWLARPAFLPLGSGPDLTHHLLLIEFIERHWTLVHEARVETYLGEMVHYTPGSHVLTALAGALARSDGFHLVHLVVAASVALKAGLVLLIALRVLPSNSSRTPLALGAVALMFAPRPYVVGSFTHESFFAQVVAECFSVALWWSATVWDVTPSLATAVFFSFVGAAVFLTWPVFIGAPVVTFAALVALRRDVPIPRRAEHFLAAVAIVGTVAALYIVGRAGWMQIVRTGGSILRPTVREYGGWFLALSALGTIFAFFERRARATLAFAAAIGLEMLGLFLVARTRANDTPYMALKMFYLLVYPQAVLAALGVAGLLQGLFRAFSGTFRRPSAQFAASAMALILCVFAARPFATTISSTPAATEDLARAGEWTKAHLPPSCVDYLVGDSDTGYWLHLAVLGNPRMSARTGSPDTFDRTAAILRWLSPSGYPYAIADLRSLPSDVRSDLDVVADFGTAAVVRRRAGGMCQP